MKSRKASRLPVLVIEDNADHWLVIRSTLAHCFPEVEPIWINNPNQVSRYIEETLPDRSKIPLLILMELHLPNSKAGCDLLTLLKAHPLYRQIPVTVLSHSQESTDITRSYALGAASYVTKPNTIHEWMTYFHAFRRYWWEVVALPRRLLLTRYQVS